MFYLRTGSLGAGKTLHTLKEVAELSKKDNRPVYYFNIELTPEGEEFLGDNWHRITKEDIEQWEDYPPGTIFFIDECHKVFPLRPASKAVPDWIQALAEHRSKGIDFYIITQHRNDIDVFIRRRIQNYIDYSSKFGMNNSSYEEIESPDFNEELWRQNPSKGNKPFPKEYFNYYVSSVLHTKKRKLPWYFFALPILLIFIVFIFYLVFSFLGSLGVSDSSGDSTDTTAQSHTTSSPSSVAASAASPDQYNPIVPDALKMPSSPTLAKVPKYILDAQKVYLTGQAFISQEFGGSFSNYLIVHADGESTPITNEFFIQTGGQILVVDKKCTHRIIYADFQLYTRCKPEPIEDDTSDDNDNPNDNTNDLGESSIASLNPFKSNQ